MPVVNVSAKLAPQRKPRLTDAKLTPLATHRKSGAPAATPAVPSATAKQRAASLVHLTSANAAPVAFTETLFVVVEGSQQNIHEDQPVFQIQMWRVDGSASGCRSRQQPNSRETNLNMNCNVQMRITNFRN